MYSLACPRIEIIQAATKFASETPILTEQPKSNGRGEIKLPSPILTSLSFGEVVRARLSALDFRGGEESICFKQLATLLGLAPGVYRYWEDNAELEQIMQGDQRLVAAALSLGQDLAGNACVAFSMIGDFENATRRYGDRDYRYVHFEAGAKGQRIYLAAEALGLRATGIGAFFDDEVHKYLRLTPEQGQVVYHSNGCWRSRRKSGHSERNSLMSSITVGHS